MSSAFSVASNEHLIRDELWSRQLKQLLLDELFAMKFVRTLTEFPDGTTFTIPSIGEAESSDYAEGQVIKYNRMDTGEYQFSFDQYKYSAHAITEKFKRDSYYASDVIASFAPRQHRALMEAIETRIFNRASAGQTASNANTINGADHRWVGNGTSESIALVDFAKAKYSLRKANVPLVNLVAIVDPSVAYTIETQTNLVNLMSPNRMWDNMVMDGGMSTGIQFKYNVYGFDVYVSNYLPGAGSTNAGAETIGARSTTVGVCNLFFSAASGDTCPLIGGFRQMPTVYSEFNKDLQQTEYLTICEYGFKLYRPENMVIVLTDTDVVSF